jgi:phosphohistidine phosphatase
MRLVLVHHADAVGPEVDPQRPLSPQGVVEVAALAQKAKAHKLTTAAIWHSGKLRARQTAETFLRVCSPFADFKMVHGLRPDDSPRFIREAVDAEDRDIMAVGHMPHLAILLREMAPGSAPFPLHGLVVLERMSEGYEEGLRLTT